MKKKSDHDKALEITNNILKKNSKDKAAKNKDTKDMRFEAGEGFDSLDFSPEDWSKE